MTSKEKNDIDIIWDKYKNRIESDIFDNGPFISCQVIREGGFLPKVILKFENNQKSFSVTEFKEFCIMRYESDIRNEKIEKILK